MASQYTYQLGEDILVFLEDLEKTLQDLENSLLRLKQLIEPSPSLVSQTLLHKNAKSDTAETGFRNTSPIRYIHIIYCNNIKKRSYSYIK